MKSIYCYHVNISIALGTSSLKTTHIKIKQMRYIQCSFSWSDFVLFLWKHATFTLKAPLFMVYVPLCPALDTSTNI